MSKFKVGDLVYKSKGYKYPGTVVSCFLTSTNEERYVVEHSISEGMLHIFSGPQLALDQAKHDTDEGNLDYVKKLNTANQTLLQIQSEIDKQVLLSRSRGELPSETISKLQLMLETYWYSTSTEIKLNS